MAMNTEDSLREYLRLFVKVPLVGRIGPLARTFDFVADAAPGVKEILAVGKLAYEVRERHYDLVVVDAEASGHIVAQIAAPRVISELVQVGMVREQTRWMTEILEDPAVTGLVVVTTPEEMPVTETIELLGRLDRETGVAPSAIVANRVLPALFDRRQAEVVDRLAEVEQMLVDAAGPGVRQVLAAAQVTEARRRIGSRHLERLRAGHPGRPARALRARAVHQGHRPAGRRPGRRGPGRRTGRARNGADDGRRSASTPCWRARRWCSCSARAASARRRSPPPSAWPPPSTRAAGCSC